MMRLKRVHGKTPPSDERIARLTERSRNFIDSVACIREDDPLGVPEGLPDELKGREDFFLALAKAPPETHFDVEEKVFDAARLIQDPGRRRMFLDNVSAVIAKAAESRNPAKVIRRDAKWNSTLKILREDEVREPYDFETLNTQRPLSNADYPPESRACFHASMLETALADLNESLVNSLSRTLAEALTKRGFPGFARDWNGLAARWFMSAGEYDGFGFMPGVPEYAKAVAETKTLRRPGGLPEIPV